jgi:hypothetical protein
MADTEHEEDKRCTLFDKPKRYCTAHMDWHAEDEFKEYCEAYCDADPIRLCKTCGGWHPLNAWGMNCMPEKNWLESDLDVCRSFISDNLESIGGINGIQSMADGRMYTSKSRLRAEYRARGLTEMGNDKAPAFKKPKPDRTAIRDAVRRAAWQVEHEGATATAYRTRAKRAPTPFGPVAK